MLRKKGASLISSGKECQRLSTATGKALATFSAPLNLVQRGFKALLNFTTGSIFQYLFVYLFNLGNHSNCKQEEMEPPRPILDVSLCKYFHHLVNGTLKPLYQAVSLGYGVTEPPNSATCILKCHS